MITKRSRFFSGLLALLMVASLFAAIPFTAGAEDPSVTVTPDMCYGTIYNEEGDPEGEGLIPYDGTNVRIDFCNVDLDGDYDENWDFWTYEFGDDEEDRSYADVSAKNGNVISKLVVTVDTDISDGSPVIVGSDDLISGTRDGDKFTFANINASRVRLSADAYYVYFNSIQVFYRPLETYTVTWKNADGTVINTTNVTEGNVPTHAKPTKAADAEHTYTFAGWTDGTTTYGANDALPAVSGDTTYTAVFTSSVRQYTITWKLDANTVIDTTSVAYGTVPTHADPTKDADAQYTYTFAGWTPELAPVTGDAEYTATYTTKLVARKELEDAIASADSKTSENNYKATYEKITRDALTEAVDAANTVLENSDAAVEELVAAKSSVEAAVEGLIPVQCTYQVSVYKSDKGWHVYKKNQTATSYSIGGGDFMVAVGHTSGTWWIYKNKGSNTGIMSISGNNITSWSKRNNLKVILNGVGTGSAKVTPAWTNSAHTSASAGGDATIQAKVERECTFVAPENYSGVYDGNPHTIGDINVIAPLSGAVVRYRDSNDAYTLTEPPVFTDAGTYTVYYQVSAPNDDVGAWITQTGSATVTIEQPTYTVTWKNYDGSVIGTSTVEEGVTPEFLAEIGEIKAKPEDDDYTYTFAGWTPELVAVTEDAEYTAIFNAEPKTLNGLHLDADGEIRFYVDDVAIHAGLVQDDEGNYYYINSELKAVKDCTYGIAATMANGLLPEGFYTFGEDGKLVSPLPVNKDGISLDEDGKIRYYVMGFAVSAGLVQDAEGNYYYISSDKTAVTSCEYFIGTKKANGLLPAGYYTFGADGKIVFPQPPEDKNGLIFDADGEIRFYVDGVAVYAGLVEYEGDFYYINSAKKAIKNCTYGITTAKANGLVETGLYTFDADGKMIVD